MFVKFHFGIWFYLELFTWVVSAYTRYVFWDILHWQLKLSFNGLGACVVFDGVQIYGSLEYNSFMFPLLKSCEVLMIFEILLHYVWQSFSFIYREVLWYGSRCDGYLSCISVIILCIGIVLHIHAEVYYEVVLHA